MDYSNFDIIKYLDDRNINYYTHGKNISKGWVGAACPFCGDSSTHLGIHLQSKAVTCFRCGKHSLFKYIQELEGIPKGKVFQILEQFQDREYSYLDNKKRETTEGEVQLPKGSSKNFAGIFQNYILSRNFIPEEVIKQFDLYCCHLIGDFKFRIIAPIYQDFELLSYTGRDVSGKSNLRYMNAPLEESKKPVKECVYNLDTVKDKAIIVEGVTDVWRLGNECVATFGTQYTKAQVALLSRLKKAFILYDSDASVQAEKLGNDLSSTVDSVEVLTLSHGDPADMSDTEALLLKKKLFA